MWLFPSDVWMFVSQMRQEKARRHIYASNASYSLYTWPRSCIFNVYGDHVYSRDSVCLYQPRVWRSKRAGQQVFWMCSVKSSVTSACFQRKLAQVVKKPENEVPDLLCVIGTIHKSKRTSFSTVCIETRSAKWAILEPNSSFKPTGAADRVAGSFLWVTFSHRGSCVFSHRTNAFLTSATWWTLSVLCSTACASILIYSVSFVKLKGRIQARFEEYRCTVLFVGIKSSNSDFLAVCCFLVLTLQ